VLERPGPEGVDPSAAERIAAAAPDARVVKAFNLCHVDVWRLTPPVFDGRPLAVPLCGDDERALSAYGGWCATSAASR
jgi:predicted dinucleotide-binding enzyme